MKLQQKILITMAIIALLFVPAGGVFAIDIKPNYLSFTGTVKEINPFYDRDGNVVEGTNFVLVENDSGQLNNFRVTKDTYQVTGNELKVGSIVTGFYDATRPMILIYPPQPTIVALVVDLEEKSNIFMDTFNEYHISVGNFLKLNITDETKIELQNGSTYTGELADKNLIVFYTISTKSIPAQTTPSRIIVVENMDILANDSLVQSPQTFIKQDGTIMLPIRAVAEEIGYQVEWNNIERKVILKDEANNEISFKLNENLYKVNNKQNIELEIAPELINSTTYVPLNFFKEILNLNQAELIKGKIIMSK